MTEEGNFLCKKGCGGGGEGGRGRDQVYVQHVHRYLLIIVIEDRKTSYFINISKPPLLPFESHFQECVKISILAL